MKLLPVLSFPVARKLRHTVGEFVKSADLQADVAAEICRSLPALNEVTIPVTAPLVE